MFIKDVNLENFKNIKFLEIKADGNHIIITGVNGTGKTAALEAILTLLFGKKVLPDDPVMHGAESSLISCGITDDRGGEVKFKIKARISDDIFGLTISTFLAGGIETTVKKPIDFLSKIVTRDFIDPEEFCRKSGKDRIAMLYKLLPDLQSKIDALSKEYEEEQSKRSQINIDKTKLEGELLNKPFVDGLPESEIDPADILVKMNEAETHNLRKIGLSSSVENTKRDISVRKEMVDMVKQNIESLKKQLLEKENELQSLNDQLATSESALLSRVEELDAFVPRDVTELRAQVVKLKTTNESIRINRRHLEIKKELIEKSTQFSAGLDRMRAIEQKKVNLYKEAKMPVEGLEVGNADITFPDPTTGERVMFGSLSTGQQCRIAVGILAKFLPSPDEGIRAMIITDANALDESNYMAMLDAANENMVQLIMHKTAFRSESNQLEIRIEERK